MTSNTNLSSQPTVSMRLDKAAQTRVKSSPKPGVMQAVDRELHAPAPGVAFTVEGDLYSVAICWVGLGSSGRRASRSWDVSSTRHHRGCGFCVQIGGRAAKNSDVRYKVHE